MWRLGTNSTRLTLREVARCARVTRLARLTGLDRLGIEVVGAIRPGGHVLQVSQGKGLTLAQAQWSAVGEALELTAAEDPDVERLMFGPPPADALWANGPEQVAWVSGTLLGSGAGVSVPADAVYCPPAGCAWLGPSSSVWVSNGLGAHPEARAAAVEHAVLELVERDAVARALRNGWTARAAKRCLVEAPAALASQIQAAGFRVFVFDLTPRNCRLSVAGALLFDVEQGPVPLTAGYACRRRIEDACVSAVLEAAQSRLTEIHGAREDVTLGQREPGLAMLEFLEGLSPRRPVRRSYAGPLAAAVRAPVAVVTLREAPWVVKAVSHGLRLSELLEA